MTKNTFAVVAILVLTASICFGQANLATLTGVVTDSAGGVIPGAEVTVINTGTADSRDLTTSAVGSYTFPSLNPGDYQLIVTSEGFQQHVEQGIILRTGDNRRLDVELQLGQVTESVTVDAQMVTLNTENGMIKGDVIVMEEIQELPLNGRDFTDLAFFVPGVVPGASAQGSFASVNGARPTNTNFYVDGFDNRNVQGGAAQVRPNIDALQEFKMEDIWLFGGVRTNGRRDPEHVPPFGDEPDSRQHQLLHAQTTCWTRVHSLNWQRPICSRVRQPPR